MINHGLSPEYKVKNYEQPGHREHHQRQEQPQRHSGDHDGGNVFEFRRVQNRHAHVIHKKNEKEKKTHNQPVPVIVLHLYLSFLHIHATPF